MIAAVRKALGRTSALTAAPIPPAIDEPTVRLVHSDVGLPELLAGVAARNNMQVSVVHPEELLEGILQFLKANQVKSIGLTQGPLIRQLNLLAELRQAGFNARPWDELTLDDAYALDCGLTDVWAAVAEVGGLVMRSSAEHGRALSLIPPLHIAIVEPKNIVPDLVDLFQMIPRDQNDRMVIITGPSKTADIEMNLVTGVHGPGAVQLFILQ